MSDWFALRVGVPAVEAVGGAYLGGDGHREAVAFGDGLHRLEVEAQFFDGEDERAGGWACQHHFVAYGEGAVLEQELPYPELGEIAHGLG